MDEVTLPPANELGLCIFAYGFDVPLRVYYTYYAEARRFRVVWIRKLHLLKFPTNYCKDKKSNRYEVKIISHT